MEQEIRIHRPVSAIQSKIKRLVGQFKVALDESKNTGHGIKLEQGKLVFRNSLLEDSNNFLC